MSDFDINYTECVFNSLFTEVISHYENVCCLALIWQKGSSRLERWWFQKKVTDSAESSSHQRHNLERKGICSELSYLISSYTVHPESMDVRMNWQKDLHVLFKWCEISISNMGHTTWVSSLICRQINSNLKSYSIYITVYKLHLYTTALKRVWLFWLWTDSELIQPFINCKLKVCYKRQTAQLQQNEVTCPCSILTVSLKTWFLW